MDHGKKQQQILEAAIRRFAHFGFAKTTMADIAKDLSFSKGLLYYYYPDKHSLYAAALALAMEQSFEGLKEAALKQEDPKDAILLILDKRMAFITQHYNFLRSSFDAVRQMPEAMAKVLGKARDHQIGLITDILCKGMRQGRLGDMDEKQVANIILFAIEGMRFSLLKDLNGSFFPSEEEFDRVLALQKEMVRLLFEGLSLKTR